MADEQKQTQNVPEGEPKKVQGAQPETLNQQADNEIQQQSQQSQEGGETLPLTQERFNEVYRKWKDSERRNEKLSHEVDGLRSEYKTLRQTVESYQEPEQPKYPAGVEVPYAQRTDMSEDEWNTWFQENPGAATDWRAAKKYREERRRDSQRAQETTFLSDQARSREKIVATHPDMYQKDQFGNVRRTAEGVPMLDLNNPKVALFNEVVRNNPELGKVRTGPELAMREMEKLMEERNIDPKKVYNEGVQQGIQQAQTAANNAQAGFTVGATGSPPPQQQKVAGNAMSDEERRVAARMGITDADYVANRGVPRRAPRTKVDYS